MGLLGILGNGLERVSAATNGGSALSNFDLNQQAVQAAQTQNQTQQSALAALAEARKNGVTNPQQILSTLATIDPQYTEKAATIQAQNPLASLLNGNNGSGGQANSNLTGDDFLKALPPPIANQVKGYAEGKIQPSPYMMKTSAGQQMMQLVSQYDPTFDATNYGARAATRKDFTSGKSAQNITSLNTAMGHLSSLSDAYDKLDNSGSPIWNSIANATQNAIGFTDAQKATQAATSDVSTRAHAVSEELAKVFRSTGMAEADVKAWEDKINTSSSPAQSKAVINSAIELMNSRLDALGQQYNQGMGTSKNGIELLSPQAQKSYQKLTGSAAPQTGVSGNMAADNAKQAAADPVTQAKAAGYTDAEIKAYLAKKGKK